MSNGAVKFAGWPGAEDSLSSTLRVQQWPVWLITSRSQIRIIFPQLEPHGRETMRPWGFVLRWRRVRARYPLVSQRSATLKRLPTSLSRRRVRAYRYSRSTFNRTVSVPVFGRLFNSHRLGSWELSSRKRFQPIGVGFQELNNVDSKSTRAG